MIQKDYIMRLIEQLAGVMIQVLFHKKAQDYDAALVEITKAYSGLLGLDADVVRTLDADALIQLLRSVNQLTPHGTKALGDLLAEEADVLRLQQATPNAIDVARHKALLLYLESHDSSKKQTPEQALVDKIDVLTRALLERSLSVGTVWRVFTLMQEAGRFGRAEDLLFTLKETQAPGVINAGVQFYQKLQGLSDQALEAANLPREEVQEGLAIFLMLAEHKNISNA